MENDKMDIRCENNEFNWILITFPGGGKSIMRMGVFREVFDGGISNAKVVNFDIWSISLPEQLQLIEEYMSDTEYNIIIFIPGAKFRKYIPRPLITALKGKYPNVPVLLYLLDGIERQAVNMKISISKCLTILSDVDAIYSYDLYESRKYGFAYEPAPLKKFDILQADTVSNPKVFFCGRAKGRLSLIFDIADALEAHNIEYEFLVLSDAETEGRKDTGGIRYIEYLPYDKVIEHISQATVLLSLVAQNNNMTSLSYNEAIMYNKKLLTNCAFLSDNLYYNGQYMRAFQTVEDIDFKWIQNKEKVEYHYNGQYCCKNFFKHLEKDYERGLLRRCMALNRFRPESGVSPSVSLHLSKVGWTDFYANGEMILGNNAIEAIFMTGLPGNLGLNIEIVTVKAGMQVFSQAGTMVFAGSIGKSDPIFRIRFRPDNNDYQVICKCYITHVGWTEYCTEGWCGVQEDANIRIEGIQIIIRKNRTG